MSVCPFDLSVAGTIEKLDLKKPVYAQTAVGGTTNKDYETSRNDDTKWFAASIPQEAFRREYGNSMLFVLPNKDDFGGMTYFIPSVFVGEDKNSDDGRIEIRLP